MVLKENRFLFYFNLVLDLSEIDNFFFCSFILVLALVLTYFYQTRALCSVMPLSTAVARYVLSPLSTIVCERGAASEKVRVGTGLKLWWQLQSPPSSTSTGTRAGSCCG